MSITVKDYGAINGKTVYAYTLDNGKGLSAEILNYGGIITKLVFMGVDVALGLDSFEEYLHNTYSFGAIIGRNSNRIENSEFELNGKVYKLFPNDGKNNLHGGRNGFQAQIWDAECADDGLSLVLRRISPDNEEGFPGTVNVKVIYTLTVDNDVQIHYEGESSADTVINMTNHTYFNLNGHNSGSVDGHSLWLASSFFTPNTIEGIPDGQIISSKGTPFDFTVETTIGENLAIEHEQTSMLGGGYDHNLVLDGRGYRLAGMATGDKSGIVMELYTDRPGVQLYVPSGFNPERAYKDNAVYGPHNAFCLETQAFPNSVRFSHFPETIVRKGDIYNTTTTYKFK